MLKIVSAKKAFGQYAEVSQVNPLRWRLCFKEKDNTLVPQSNWWKCKDFLNDVVFFLRTKKVFSIYSFNNKQEINEEGGYLALKHVAKSFDHNLTVLNKYLSSKNFPELTSVEFDKQDGETEKVLLVPPTYWQNTFYISYITALIRACCFEKGDTINALADQEHYLQNGWFEKLDKMFDIKLMNRMNELIFINYQYHGDKCESTYNIHNAGMQTWFNSKETYKL